MKCGKRVSATVLAVVAVLVFGGPDCLAVDATWTATDPGLWTDVGNWDTGIYPNAIGDTARFAGSGNYVGLDASITLGRLVLSQSPAGYFIDGSLGGSLTLDNGGTATLEAEGTHYIAAPMTLVNALTIRNTWLAGSGSTDLYLQDPIDGNANLTIRADLGGVKWLPTAAKPGTNVYLTAENTFNGNVAIRSGSSLTLLGGGTAASASGFDVYHSASLTLDNYDVNVPNRVAAPVVPRGGTFRFCGTPGDLSFAEVPLVSFMGGASTVECAHGPDGQAILVLQNWGWSFGSTANFTGRDLGNRDQIHIRPATGGPTLRNGILGGQFTVGSDFASYDLFRGVVPLADYFMGDINDATPADNVLVSGWANVTAPKTINSLKVLGGTWVGLAETELRIETGGLMIAPGDSWMNYAVIYGGTLTAGGEDRQLTVHLQVPSATIASNITDNVDGNVWVTASGNGSPLKRRNPTLSLMGQNSYSRATSVIGCTLAVFDDMNLGDPSAPLWLNGGTLQATESFVSGRLLNLQGMAAIETPGTTLTLQNSISGNADPLYVRGGGTLVLAADNTFTGSVNVGLRQALALTEGGRLSEFVDLTLRAGASLILDNSGAPAMSRAPCPVASRGGEILMIGNPVVAAPEEIPAVAALTGASIIRCASMGQPTLLAIDSLKRACGATVDFQAADPLSQIALTDPAGPPPLINGILGGWAVSGNDWATLDLPSPAVRPLLDPEYYTGDINTALPFDNLKVVGPAMLMVPWVSVNSVKMACLDPLDLNGNILSLESGGLLFGAECGDNGGGITNGILTAGMFLGMVDELVVHLRTNAFLNATIVESAPGLALTVSGDPASGANYTLSLTPGNAYSGPTAVNAATLAITDDSALGYPLLTLSLVDATLRAEGTFESYRPLRLDGEATIEVASGCRTTWNGPVFGDVETLLVAGGGTLVLNAENTFQGDIIVGARSPGGPPMVGIAPRAGKPGSRTTAEFTWPTLSIGQDADLGDPENAVTLNGGSLEITRSFRAGPQRVFTVDSMGGVFVVGPTVMGPMGQAGTAVGSIGPVTFVLGEPDQLVVRSTAMAKSGSGTMILAASNSEIYESAAMVWEGILELQHPLSFPSLIELSGGHLNLRNDEDTIFESSVDLWSNATIDVGPLTQPEPRQLSLATLYIGYGTELTATGSGGYSLGVAYPCNIGAVATINTASADVTLWSGLNAYESESSLLTKSGPQALNLYGTVESAGAVTLYATQGTLNLNADVHDTTYEHPRSVTVTVEGEGTVANLNTPLQHLAALNLASGGRAVLTTGRSAVLMTNALNIAEDGSGVATATLDITTGAMVVDYSAPGTPNPLANVQRWIKQAYNYQEEKPTIWDGKGITSSSFTEIDPETGMLKWDPAMYTIGYADNAIGGDWNPYGDGTGDYPLFGNVTPVAVPLQSVLVKFTFIGDLNLNGQVDDNDAGLMGMYYDGFAENPRTDRTWFEGDIVDFDGICGDNDVGAFSNMYGYGTAYADPLPPPPEGPIPEPATLGLVAVALAGILAKRRRAC